MVTGAMVWEDLGPAMYQFMLGPGMGLEVLAMVDFVSCLTMFSCLLFMPCKFFAKCPSVAVCILASKKNKKINQLDESTFI